VRFAKDADQPSFSSVGGYYLVDCRSSVANAFISGGAGLDTGSGVAGSSGAAAVTPLPYALIGDLYWPLDPSNITTVGGTRLALDAGTAGIKAHLDLPSNVLVGSEGSSFTMYLDAASWPYPSVTRTVAPLVPSGFMQSVCLWFWKTSANPDGGYQALFQRNYAGGSRGFSLWVSGTNILGQTYGTGGYTVSFNSFTAGIWNHVCLVFRGDAGMGE
jgi:hypothetical protein